MCRSETCLPEREKQMSTEPTARPYADAEPERLGASPHLSDYWAVKYIRGYGIRLLFAIMIILAGSSVALKQFEFTGIAGVVVMTAALGMCAVIMIKLWLGFKKEKAEKAGQLQSEEGIVS